MKQVVAALATTFLISGCVGGYVSDQVVDLNDEVTLAASSTVAVMDDRESLPEYKKVASSRQLLGESMISPGRISLLETSIVGSVDGSKEIAVDVRRLDVFRDYSHTAFWGSYGALAGAGFTIVAAGDPPKSNYVILEFSGLVNAEPLETVILVPYKEGYSNLGFWGSPGFQEAVVKAFNELGRQISDDA